MRLMVGCMLTLFGRARYGYVWRCAAGVSPTRRLPNQSIKEASSHFRLSKSARGANEIQSRYSIRKSEMGTFDTCLICAQPGSHTHKMDSRWIGVDFDGTLAFNIPDRRDPYELGLPIPEMVARVREWLAKGYEVRIFTARMNTYSTTTSQVRDTKHMWNLLWMWSVTHIGTGLQSTCEKDGAMEVLWDDRAVRFSPVEDVK